MFWGAFMGLGHFYFVVIGGGGEIFLIINIFRILGNNGTRKKCFVQIRLFVGVIKIYAMCSPSARK